MEEVDVGVNPPVDGGRRPSLAGIRPSVGSRRGQRDEARQRRPREMARVGARLASPVYICQGLGPDGSRANGSAHVPTLCRVGSGRHYMSRSRSRPDTIIGPGRPRPEDHRTEPCLD